MSSPLSRFPEDTPEQILQTLQVLRDELAARQGGSFDLRKFCTAPDGRIYEKQHAAIVDQAYFGTDTTTRRAGKTTGRVADHIDTALRFPGSTSVYITTTHKNAKAIMFPILLQVIRDHGIKAKANIADLSVACYNGSVIHLAGVNNSQAVNNFRGMKLKLVTVDEAQSMREYIEDLVDNVLGPALFDLNGRLRVTGTPGPVPVGYFYKISHSKEWAHHFYSIFDNPFISDAHQRLQLELQRRGVPITHPSIQREYFGRWMNDPDALVIKYDPDKNHYDDLPAGVTWEHIVIADFGFDDADAIATLAFSAKHPDAFLVEEKITTKQGITPLAEQLNDHIKRYNPMKVLGDFGALGKKIGEELQKRFGIPIEAAEKSRKLEYIELLNDSLRTGRLRAKKDSRFAQDSQLLEWDRDNPEKPKIKDTYHSDIVDAVIYGHRELLHYLWEAPKIVPEIGSSEHWKAQEREIWDAVRQQRQQDKDDENFWRDDWQ